MVLFVHANGDNDEAIETAFWGTYRSYPYVGLRCQSPHSPLVGLMWYQPLYTSSTKTNRPSQASKLTSIKLRHECNYNDNLQAFGWTKHNGISYAKQNIIDEENQISLMIQWIKPKVDDDPNHWVLRIKGLESPPKLLSSPSSQLSLLWYVATPNNLTATFNASFNRIIGMQPDRKRGRQRQYCLSMRQSEQKKNRPAHYQTNRNETVLYNSTYFYAIQVDPSVYYDPKPYLLQELANPTSMVPPHLFDPDALYRAATPRTGNQIVNQVFWELPFQMELHFSYDCETSLPKWDDVTKALEKADKEFDATFSEKLLRANKGKNVTLLTNYGWGEFGQRHDDDDSPMRMMTSNLPEKQHWSLDEIRTAQYSLSNLLGSMTYMFGQGQIYLVELDKIVHTAERELFVIVPDRPNHGQGYLWDEGFHQHLVSLWDMDLTIAILSSWWNQTSLDGWIARQQIVGAEIQWSAKPSSWPQVPGTANPPSHHLVLETLLDRASTTKGSKAYAFFRNTKCQKSIVS